MSAAEAAELARHKTQVAKAIRDSSVIIQLPIDETSQTNPANNSGWKIVLKLKPGAQMCLEIREIIVLNSGRKMVTLCFLYV